MIEEELRIVSDLTGINKEKIKFSDDGFLSRGYVIDNGRIVFKFKKHSDVSYKNEIKMLNFINTLGLKIDTQKVGWTSENDDYLGIYGVVGKSLETVELTDEKRKSYGAQISEFLKTLHVAIFEGAETISVRDEVIAWQKRFENSKDVLAKYFDNIEISKMNDFVYSVVPEKMQELGEKMVFSHGDLGMGNIFVDDNDKIGVIDFSESVYLDEAADFMDIEDDKMREEVLNSYDADKNLREKVAIRRDIRPMFVIGTYRNRPENEINRYVDRIRNWLNR